MKNPLKNLEKFILCMQNATKIECILRNSVRPGPMLTPTSGGPRTKAQLLGKSMYFS